LCTTPNVKEQMKEEQYKNKNKKEEILCNICCDHLFRLTKEKGFESLEK